MATFEFVPLDELTTNEINAVANQVHNIVSRPDMKTLLRARHLWGVVSRHKVSHEVSTDNLERAAQNMLAGKMAAYVVMLEDGTDVVGLATTQPGLALYRQDSPVLLPAALTRNKILGHRVVTPETNVAAWVDPNASKDTQIENQIAELYSYLRAAAPDSWTIEPLEKGLFDVGPVNQGIRGAGYTSQGNWPELYDDMEAGIKFPKRSMYYIAEQ